MSRLGICELCMLHGTHKAYNLILGLGSMGPWPCYSPRDLAKCYHQVAAQPGIAHTWSPPPLRPSH